MCRSRSFSAARTSGTVASYAANCWGRAGCCAAGSGGTRPRGGARDSRRSGPYRVCLGAEAEAQFLYLLVDRAVGGAGEQEVLHPQRSCPAAPARDVGIQPVQDDPACEVGAGHPGEWIRPIAAQAVEVRGNP
jgi:hypothetical protein